MIYLLMAQLMFAAPAPVPVTDDGVSLELVEDSFDSPLYLTAPDGDDRLFVVERGGAVKVVVNNQPLSTPYLDVENLLPASPGSEQGLLGMAFHPDFASNGKLYISYTDSVGALVVGELVATPSANTVSTAGLRTIIRVSQPFANHNGGMLLFGPDDYLYIGSGDGGSGGDPQGNGQNKETLLGKILRIDINSDAFPSDPLRNYTIPASNPFVGAAGADEIWVYGLRNPWRFWIDHPTGRMYIADVGQSSREEVTILEASAGGANLGWDLLEGTQCYPPGATCSSAGTVLPQLEYVQSGGASITGGMVYRGPTIPKLYGTYFYGDFIGGWVKSFEYNGTVTSHLDWSGVFDTALVSSFGVDGRGEMYIVSLSGPVWRIQAPAVDDEIFFYREDGTFRYYDIGPDATLGAAILSGPGYSKGWDSITAVDLDGDGRDGQFFYRSSDGVFKYYGLTTAAKLVGPVNSGTYSKGWDSITAVDLDGGGSDEQFFYRSTDGVFKYYGLTTGGALVGPINSGTYSKGWDAITAVDLDGDGQDEMLFYRSTDGVFKYYGLTPGGALVGPISSGVYSKNWDVITAIDLDGNGRDEMLFYRVDGTFKYYEMNSNGTLGPIIQSGTGYSTGWSSITAVNLD